MTQAEILELGLKAGMRAALDYEYRGSYLAMTILEREEFDKLLHYTDLVLEHVTKD